LLNIIHSPSFMPHFLWHIAIDPLKFIQSYLRLCSQDAVFQRLTSRHGLQHLCVPHSMFLLHAGFLQQLLLWQEMGYVFRPDHPGYNLVTMRQLAMRYDAGEELASITANLAVPSESTTQVDPTFASCLFHCSTHCTQGTRCLPNVLLAAAHR